MSKIELKVNDLLTLSDGELYEYFSESEHVFAPDTVREKNRNVESALDELIAANADWMFAEGFKYAVKLLAGQKEGEKA